MILNAENGTMSSGAVICITFDEMITTARCNRESISDAFDSILKYGIEDAKAMVKQYENELEQAAKK